MKAIMKTFEEAQAVVLESPIDSLELFPWNSLFEIGVEEVDKQHKELVSLMNNLARNLIRGDRPAVDYIYDELVMYTRYHFQTEELVWGRVIPQTDEWLIHHATEHASFLPKASEFVINEGKEPTKSIERIVHFLIRWAAFHILGEDKKMGFLLNALESGVPLEQAHEFAQTKFNESFTVLIELILTLHESHAFYAIDLIREKNERIRMENELKNAHKEIKMLEGIIPICSYCKKIRNTDGEWEVLESYISSHSEAHFSHGMCPHCVSEHYPDLLLDDDLD